MKKIINLSTSVIVSDPSYSLPTWCQAVIDDVKAGEYEVSCKQIDDDDWGQRNTLLMVIHKGYDAKELDWVMSNSIIGVDSGQAGIFAADSYRKNPDDVPMGSGDIAFFGEAEDDADMWYQKICSFTLCDDGWGVYKSGAVSSSGIGDGSYNLFLAYDGEEVVGFVLDFGIEEFDNVTEVF